MQPKFSYKDHRQVFQENEVDGVVFLTFPLLSDTGVVKHAFSTRLGGVSKGCYAAMNISTARGDVPENVQENRCIMARALAVDPQKMTYTQQVHGTHVAVVKAEDAGKTFPETDGLMTNVPGICLVTFHADCVPLYFVDPVNHVIALSHAGWRGTVQKIGAITLERMKEIFHCRPEQVIAAIGPSICRDCYEVGEEVIDQFKATFPRDLWPDVFSQKPAQKGTGKYQLDLWKANEIILLEAGIKASHLTVTNLCTHCNPDLLFSHRFMGNKRGTLSAFLSLQEEV